MSIVNINGSIDWETSSHTRLGQVMKVWLRPLPFSTNKMYLCEFRAIAGSKRVFDTWNKTSCCWSYVKIYKFLSPRQRKIVDNATCCYVRPLVPKSNTSNLDMNDLGLISYSDADPFEQQYHSPRCECGGDSIKSTHAGYCPKA